MMLKFGKHAPKKKTARKSKASRAKYGCLTTVFNDDRSVFHGMLKLHLHVVNLCVTAAFNDDIFAEAKKIIHASSSVVRGA